MPKRNIILYACGSRLIVDYLEVCLRSEIEIKSIVNNLPGPAGCEVPCVSSAAYDFANETIPFLVPLFTPRNRYVATQEALKHGLHPFDLLSDPGSDLPAQFAHGVGCFISRRVVIGSTSTIGDHVLINRGACLGHHTVMEDFVSIGPGVVTGGDVTIRGGVMVGAGAVILPDVTIGEHAVVGAGSVVTRAVPPFDVVVGNPARRIRANENTF